MTDNVAKLSPWTTREWMVVVHTGPWPRIEGEIPKRHSSLMYLSGIPWTLQSQRYA